MSCEVNFRGEARNEDGSISDIQPSEEHRRRVMDGLGKILEKESELGLTLINVAFVLPKNKSSLDALFEIYLQKNKRIDFRFSSGNGWLPSGEDIGLLVLDGIIDKIEAA